MRVIGRIFSHLSSITSRADFADDDAIQDLISYEFPQESPFSELSTSPITFTDEEDLIMFRLPSKECKYTSIHLIDRTND